MSFEEDFPSLSKEVTEPNSNFDKDKVFDEWVNSVQKHCLDKRKVKTVVRVAIGLGNIICRKGHQELFQRICEELGLEDEDEDNV